MPVSITKGSISNACINELVKQAFGCTASSIVELTEGFFNIAYKIELDGRSVILKIAPPPEIDIMTHEKNIMFSEVDSMRIVKEKTSVPVPKILFYDDSLSICERPYFFMEMLEGQSFSGYMEQMSEDEKNAIFYEVGKNTKILNKLTNDKFGYYCQKEKQGSSWYDVFKSMLEDTYADAERKAIPIPVPKNTLLGLLEKDRSIFNQVKQANFVHWDIWAGNVFVKDNKLVGIIDFERCLWADPLMEVGFRTYDYNKAFFDGYGIAELTAEQVRRAKWYDIYLFLICSLECDYRMYDNRGSYEWGCEMLQRWVVSLESPDNR